MRIKKKKQNEYFLTEDNIWVRNLCRKNTYKDINKFATTDEYKLFLKNESKNQIGGGRTAEVVKKYKKVIILSDGFDFKEKQKILSDLDFKKVAILATNGALAKWDLVGENCPYEKRRSINYYLVNNPYSDCLNFLPKKHSYYPPCIASSRTEPEFVKNYKGNLAFYHPSLSDMYAGPKLGKMFQMDDYRNPICAALSFAYKMGAEKIVLMCCDDSFKENRPGSINLEKGFYCYNKQLVSKNILDAMCFWLKKENITVKQHCSGFVFNHASYIELGDIKGFLDTDE
jgi:hypothetical protein